MGALLDIERDMGRRRIQKKGPRTIDIDILLIGDTVMDSNEVSVPHPAMHERRFVLEPLAEIAGGGERHPGRKELVQKMLDGLPDETGGVLKIHDQRPTR